MAASASVDLVRRAWEAFSRHDVDALAPFLAPAARWRAVEDGPWNCEGRAEILRRIGERAGTGPLGTLESTEEAGDRVVVGFRPDPAREPQVRPLEGGIRHVVVTVSAGRIVELRGCASRGEELAFARGHRSPSPSM